MNATELQSYPISVTPPVNGSLLAYETASNAWTPDPQTTPVNGGIYYWNGTNVVTTANTGGGNGSLLQYVSGAWNSTAANPPTFGFLYWNGSTWESSGVTGQPGFSFGNGSFPWVNGSGGYLWTPALAAGNVGLMLYWSGTEWAVFGNGLGAGETGYVATWNGSAWIVSPPSGGGTLQFNSQQLGSNLPISANTTTNVLTAPLTPGHTYLVTWQVTVSTSNTGVNVSAWVSDGVNTPSNSSGDAFINNLSPANYTISGSKVWVATGANTIYLQVRATQSFTVLAQNNQSIAGATTLSIIDLAY